MKENGNKVGQQAGILSELVECRDKTMGLGMNENRGAGRAVSVALFIPFS